MDEFVKNVAWFFRSTALSDLQEDVESTLHVDGETYRAPLVGFEAMTEPSIWIAVSPDGVDYPGGVIVVEQHCGEAALDDPSLTIKERPSGTNEFIGHRLQSVRSNRHVRWLEDECQRRILVTRSSADPDVGSVSDRRRNAARVAAHECAMLMA